MDLGVHDVHDVLLVLPLVSIFEHFPDCGLPATRGRPLLITRIIEFVTFLAICVSMSLRVTPG